MKTKNALWIAVAIFGFSTFAAVTATVETVNLHMAELLKPFKDARTSAEINFSALDLNPDRVIKLVANGMFVKVGPDNTFDLRVRNLSYSLGDDGQLPTVRLSARLRSDFLKLMTQKDFNALADDAAQSVTDFAKDIIAENGEAATVEGIVDAVVHDENNNVAAIKFHVSAALDFKKLPAGRKLEDVEWQSASARFLLSPTEFKVDGEMGLNPQYSGFQKNKVGLKESIEKLIGNDPETDTAITDLVLALDRFAESVIANRPLSIPLFR